MLDKIEELRNQQQQQLLPTNEMAEEEQKQLQNVIQLISEESLKKEQQFLNQQKNSEEDKEQNDNQNNKEATVSEDDSNNNIIDLDNIPNPPKIQKYFTVYEKKPKHRLLLKKQVSITMNQTKTENFGTSTTGTGISQFEKTYIATNNRLNDQSEGQLKATNQSEQQQNQDNQKELFIKNIQLKKIITDISKNQNSMVRSYSPTGLQNYSMLSPMAMTTIRKQVTFSKQPSQVIMQSQEIIKSQKISKLQSSQQFQRQKTFQSQLTNKSQKKRNSGFLTNKAVEQLLTKMLISSTNPTYQMQHREKSVQQLYLTPQQSYLNSMQNSPKQSRISFKKSFTFQVPGGLIKQNLQEVKGDDQTEISCNLSKKSEQTLREGEAGRESITQHQHSSEVSSSEMLPNTFSNKQYQTKQHQLIQMKSTTSEQDITISEKNPKIQIIQSSINLQQKPSSQSQLQLQQNEQNYRLQQQNSNNNKLNQQSLIEKLRLLDIRQSIISEKINENDYDAADQISEEEKDRISGQSKKEEDSISRSNTKQQTNTTALIELLRLAKQKTTLSQKSTQNQHQKKSILTNLNENLMRSDRKHKSMNPMSIPFKRTSLLLQTQVFNQSTATDNNFNNTASKINEEIRQSLKRVSFLQSSRLSSKVEFKL